MSKIKIIRETLKSILLDELKARRIMSREEVEELACDHGYVRESATRSLRATGDKAVPVRKLNQFKKPNTDFRTYAVWNYPTITRV